MRHWMTGFRAALAAVALGLAGCAPSPAPASGEPAIWRIADADSEIWLYGTVHVLPPELRWRGPRFEAAFAAAEELVTETDTQDTSYADLVARHGRLADGGPGLGGLLDAPTRTRFERVACELGIDPQTMANDRPWFAAVRLSFAYAVARGHSPDAGVENVLAPEARAAGKVLSYLETPSQQIQTLAGLPPGDELRFLAVTLRQIEQEADSLEDTDALWARGDTAALGRLLDVQLREAGPVAFDALITRRNTAWAAEIERRLAGSGRIFYALGAAHLVGEHSVVAMLRARGIGVEGP